MFSIARQSFSWSSRLLLAANITIGLALIVCYITPHVDPISYPLVSVCGLFYLFLYVLNACFLLYWLFTRRLIIAIPVALCLLPGISNVNLHFGFKRNINLEPKANNAIRLMTYNLNSFNSIDQNSSQPAIMKLVDSLKPDVLNLQELSSRVGGEGRIIDSFKNVLGTNHYTTQVFITSNTDTTKSAIFSRLPILKAEALPAPVQAPEMQVIYADIKKGENIFRVFCVHLQSTHFEPEEHKAMSDVVHFKGFDWPEIRLIFTKLKVAYKKRSYQVATIKDYLARSPYPYIITGDFNDTPSSYSVSQLSKGLKNSFTEKGQGYGVTYYRDFPSLQIDYIFASRQFEILNHKVIHARLSDHYPVLSDMVLR